MSETKAKEMSLVALVGQLVKKGWQAPPGGPLATIERALRGVPWASLWNNSGDGISIKMSSDNDSLAKAAGSDDIAPKDHYVYVSYPDGLDGRKPPRGDVIAGVLAVLAARGGDELRLADASAALSGHSHDTRAAYSVPVLLDSLEGVPGTTLWYHVDKGYVIRLEKPDVAAGHAAKRWAMPPADGSGGLRDGSVAKPPSYDEALINSYKVVVLDAISILGSASLSDMVNLANRAGTSVSTEVLAPVILTLEREGKITRLSGGDLDLFQLAEGQQPTVESRTRHKRL